MDAPAVNLCVCHRSPLPDEGRLCDDGENELHQLLSRLTPVVARGDREPLLGDDGRIVRGSYGRGMSSPWDTPSGEVAYLPRMLAEEAARLAVRSGTVIGRTPMAEVPLPVELRAVDDAGRIRCMVAMWATRLSGRMVPLDAAWDVGTVAQWLADQVSVIRMRDWAGDMLVDVRRVVGRADRRVDNPRDRHFLGPCGRTVYNLPDPSCGCACHAEPGYATCSSEHGCVALHTGPCPGHYVAWDDDPTARCTDCRTKVDVEARRAQLLADAAGLWLTVIEIRDLTAWLGDRVPPSTVCTWHKRGQITGSRPYDPTDDDPEPIRYLLGDVIARRRPKEARSA